MVSSLSSGYYPDGSWVKLAYRGVMDTEVVPMPPFLVRWAPIQITTSTGRTISIQHDLQQHPIAETISSTNSTKTHKVTFAYDADGNMTERRVLAGDTPDDTKDSIERFEYDSYGNVTSYRTASGGAWSFESTPDGKVSKVTEPNGAVWQYGYTNSGKRRWLKTPEGYEIALVYDSRGLLAEEHETYAASTPEAVTKYAYDPRGLLTKATDPFQKDWTYAYDDAGNLIREVDPEGRQTRYGYDLDRRLTSITDGNGVTVNVNYLDTAPEGYAPQYQIAFPPAVQLKYPTYTDELQYDLMDRLASRYRKASTGEDVLVQYQYDSDGNLTKVVTPDNKIYSYAYDELGRLLSATRPG